MDMDDSLIDSHSDVSSDDEPFIMSQTYSTLEKYHKKREDKNYLQLLFNDLTEENLQDTLQYLLPAVLCAEGLKLKSGYDVDELFSATIDILKIDLRQIASIILNEDLTNEGKINVALKLEEHGWLRKEDSRFFPVVSSSATSLLEKIIKGEEAAQRFKEKKAISLPMSPEQDHLAMLTFNLIYDIIMKITKNKGDAVTYNQIINEFNSLIKNNTWRTNYAELKLDENPTMNKEWFKHYTTRSALKKFVEMTKFSGIEFIPENASFRIRNNSKKFELDKWTNKMENQENVKREINNYIVDEMPKQNEPKENKERNPESQIRNDSIYDSDDSSGNGVYSDEENEDTSHKKIDIKNQKPEIPVATSPSSKKPSKNNVFLHQNYLNVSTSEDEGDDTRFSNEVIRTEGNSKAFDVNRILKDERGNENAGNTTIQNENVESRSILSRNSNTVANRDVSWKERDSDASSDSTKLDKRLVGHHSTASHSMLDDKAMSSERNKYDFSNRSTSSRIGMANREIPPERSDYDLSNRSASSHMRPADREMQLGKNNYDFSNNCASSHMGQADREMQPGQNNYDFSNRSTSSRIGMANREIPPERNNYDLSNRSTSSHMGQADREMQFGRNNYDFSNNFASSHMRQADREMQPGRNNYDFSNRSTSSRISMANRDIPPERSDYDLSNRSASSHTRAADREMQLGKNNYDFSNRSVSSHMNMASREMPPGRNNYDLSNRSTSSHMSQADRAMPSERYNYDFSNRSVSSQMNLTNREMPSERNNYEDPYEEKPWPSNRLSEENTNRNRQYNNDYEPHSYSQQSGTYRSNNRDTYKLDSRSYTRNSNRVEEETMSPGERKNIEKKYEMIQNDEEERHELEKISRERRNRYIDGMGYSQLERNRDSIPPAESSRSTISQNRTPRFSTGRMRQRFESQVGNVCANHSLKKDIYKRILLYCNENGSPIEEITLYREFGDRCDNIDDFIRREMKDLVRTKTVIRNNVLAREYELYA